MTHLIAPSILSADFANLQRDIRMLNISAADWIHVDIMDGVFVPNISLGFPILEVIRRNTSKTLDVHLMIIKPERYISRFKTAGANNLIVHFEACTHLQRTIHAIKQEGMGAGVALNPLTNGDNLENIIQDIDQVLIMSVNPGFGNQKFIEHTYQKIETIRGLINRTGSSARIEVDGGVNLLNAQKLLEVGANVLVSGSSVFGSENPTQTISALKNIVRST